MEIKDTIESSKEEVIKVEETAEKSFDSFSKFIKAKSTWIVYLLLALIVGFSTFIRTRNLHLLKDVTTGKYIPLALDPFVFLRYGQYILEHGKLMTFDMLRSVPLGFETSREMLLVSYFNVFMYKILNIFNSNITFEFIHVIYPVILFFFIIIIFFLLVRRLFNNNSIALIATAFLSVIPTFLYRTMAGFSDKEALGTFFMFLAFYFFVVSWQTKSNKNSLIFGSLSGISTALIGLTWGGFKFIFIIFGAFALIEWFLEKLSKKDVLSYSSWLIISLTILVFSPQYTLFGFFNSITSLIAIFSLFIILFDLFVLEIHIKRLDKFLPSKFPPTVNKFLISFVVIFILVSLFFGPSLLYDQISQIINGMLNTMSGDRIAVTVAEQNQPFVTQWFSNFGLLFFWMFLIGSVILFYSMLKPLGKVKSKLTLAYLVFIISFIFSKYSPSSFLNGDSIFSKFLYLGSLVYFITLISILYIKSYSRNNGLFNSISKINKNYIFLFIWFVIMIIAARSAIRLLFVFSPIISIMAAYFIYNFFKIIMRIESKSYRVLGLFFVLFIFIFPVNGTLFTFANSSYNSAEYTGPSYNSQWQYGMKWVRENTAEDSVFAHWWDYGYWVQAGGERATIVDGGHPVGYWDYLMGRHVLTAQSEIEALEFLKSHNSTHLLIISDEIGKYTAYSSIGSDVNYDRYSWITTFALQGTKPSADNVTNYIYNGRYRLDEDFVYNDVIYPKNVAAIIGFVVPIKIIEGSYNLQRPFVVINYNGNQVTIPMNCVYLNNQFANFGEDGFPGCFRMIPSIVQSQQNKFGAGLYVSEKGISALWTQLFLFDKQFDNFELVYDDSDKSPLALYNSRLIGPLKIWELNYPSNIQVNEEYLNTEYPAELMEIGQ